MIRDEQAGQGQQPEIYTPVERQRLIEGWLPLAQDANQQYGWHLDSPALEALIMSSAPALASAASAFASRAILWQVHQRQIINIA